MLRSVDPAVALQLPTSCIRGGQWLLRSGIQEAGGGVARYYNVADRRNLPVSAEITGYVAGAHAWLHRGTGDAVYLEAARRTGRYLVESAWDAELETFPFEPAQGSPAYFFDCGIIVRGLLAVWRLTGDRRLLEVAAATGRSMARDFLTSAAIHPIVLLPDRKPAPYEKRWSREPGCFQLKAALAWRDLWRMSGERSFHAWWMHSLELALAGQESFLPGPSDADKVMDRLHAWCYFMEALLAEPERSECAASLRAGIGRAATLLREIAPRFVRSDVYAQLLRVRLVADSLGMAPLDEAAASEEAAAIPAFQYSDPDTRLDGAFSFGRKGGALLGFANPVSTVFCAQALDAWRRHESGEAVLSLDELI